VNSNIYSISPHFNGASQFSQSQYCDAQGGGTGWCVEDDWIESNGNCEGATTLHTINTAANNGGCGASGCQVGYAYNGVSTFAMNVSFSATGVMTVIRNGAAIGSPSPAVGSNDWSSLVNAYTTLGGVIFSSQWTGWVPSTHGCGTSGNLAAASFTISNLQIYGSIVQGPAATGC